MIRALMADRPDHHSRIVEVSSRHHGQRLDNFLLAQLKGVPRSHVYRIVRTGEVRLNRSRARPSSRVHEGDRVRIPPIRVSAPKSTTLSALRLAAVQRILFEDEHLLVLDKPSGSAVHAGSAAPSGLIEWLRAARPEAETLELAHRLDRATSGCLLVAKSRPMLLALQSAFRGGIDANARRGMRKVYLALVRGAWCGGAREVNAAVAKTGLRAGERLMAVSAGGRAATTCFRPLRVWPGASLMEITLITGRTHQARVHAAHIDHPIAGDDKYGDKGFNREMRSRGLRRLFLHAWKLQFNHPISGREIRVQSPLPAELQALLDASQADAD